MSLHNGQSVVFTMFLPEGLFLDRTASLRVMIEVGVDLANRPSTDPIADLTVTIKGDCNMNSHRIRVNGYTEAVDFGFDQTQLRVFSAGTTGSIEGGNQQVEEGFTAHDC